MSASAEAAVRALAQNLQDESKLESLVERTKRKGEVHCYELFVLLEDVCS